MDDFQKELQGLNVGHFEAGQMTPVNAQSQYSPNDTRLCFGFGFFSCFGGGGCFGCGGCFRCGGCFGCGGCFRCGGCARCF